MTLTARNRYLLTGAIFSLVVLMVLVIFARQSFNLLPGVVEQTPKRPQGFAPFPPSPLVPLAVMMSAVAFAFVVEILIFHSFEKTQTPEMLFFSLFVVSLVFVSGRLVLLLQMGLGLPAGMSALGARAEIFGRFFGMFSIFVSGIYAANFTMQRQGTVLFAITILALLIALRVPVDSLSWQTDLSLESGYTLMFSVIELVLTALTVASFLVAAHTRGNREFFQAAVGVLLVCAGKVLLVNTDTWLILAPALMLLGVGAWLFCRALRQVYLWM
jgi:hypothetical protein